jgi:hypothetical protein
MPLPHDKATAIVTVTGLALGCYNPATENWEVGFIRHDKHVLSVKVNKELADGTSTFKFELDTNHRVFIDAENAESVKDPIFTTGGAFDRTNDNHDHEDFRWVVDLETELNNGAPVTLVHPPDPVTEMYVAKPHLYADPNSFTDKATILKNLDDETQSPFGFLAEGCNADITCKPGGGVVLRIEGPQGFSIYLPHGSGTKPHSIVFDNTCPEHNGQQPAEATTDFTLVFSVVEAPNEKGFDLLQAQEGGTGSGAICNKTFLGVSTSLFPLP